MNSCNGKFEKDKNSKNNLSFIQFRGIFLVISDSPTEMVPDFTKKLPVTVQSNVCEEGQLSYIAFVRFTLKLVIKD